MQCVLQVKPNIKFKNIDKLQNPDIYIMDFYLISKFSPNLFIWSMRYFLTEKNSIPLFQSFEWKKEFKHTWVCVHLCLFIYMYTFTLHTHTCVYIFTWNTNSNRFKDSVYIELQSNLKYSAMNTSTQKTRLSGFHSQSKGTGVSNVHWSGSGGLLVQALQWSRWYENSPHQRILVVLCMSEH